MAFPSEAELANTITPLLDSHDLLLDRVRCIPAGKKSKVVVTLDGEQVPDLDVIEAVTKEISTLFDEAESVGKLQFGAGYTLEVGSRGVDAPLTHARHWRQNQGRLVRLPGLETQGAKKVSYRIGAVNNAGDAVIIVVRRAKEVSLESIQLAEHPNAVVEIEFATPNSLEQELSTFSYDEAMQWREDHK